MESGEGIESIPYLRPAKTVRTSWNPVKELKVSPVSEARPSPYRSWNPVKELKEYKGVEVDDDGYACGIR